jgi:uncharacterized protein (DUF1810 family)
MNEGLERFIKAQEINYEIALSEIQAGQKRSHWMWYIFPQISGLGFSEISQRFAIHDLDEAKEYLNHPILGNRLREISETLLRHKESSATPIFGRPDNLKLKSCMTLFELASEEEENVFRKVLEQFFNGIADEKTVKLIGKN